MALHPTAVRLVHDKTLSGKVRSRLDTPFMGTIARLPPTLVPMLQEAGLRVTHGCKMDFTHLLVDHGLLLDKNHQLNPHGIRLHSDQIRWLKT